MAASLSRSSARQTTPTGSVAAVRMIAVGSVVRISAAKSLAVTVGTFLGIMRGDGRHRHRPVRGSSPGRPLYDTHLAGYEQVQTGSHYRCYVDLAPPLLGVASVTLPRLPVPLRCHCGATAVAPWCTVWVRSGYGLARKFRYHPGIGLDHHRCPLDWTATAAARACTRARTRARTKSGRRTLPTCCQDPALLSPWFCPTP